MEATARHRNAEAQFRELLEHGGLAQPDEVAIAPDELLFLWHEPKVAVVVELGPERPGS